MRSMEEYESIPQPELRQAFVNYFDGIILGEIATLHEAVHSIERHEIPFTNEVRGCAEWFERLAYMRTDEATEHNEINRYREEKTIAGWGLRACAYSGVNIESDPEHSDTTIEPELIRLVASSFAINKRELRNWIAPHRTVVNAIIDDLGFEKPADQERRIIRRHGFNVLQEIGIETPTDRARLAKINYRLNQSKY